MNADTTDITETNTETSVPAAQAEAPPPGVQAKAPLPAVPEVATTKSTVTHRSLAEWHGKELVDKDGERIGKLEEVYFDVETDEPQFGTVKEGLFGRHLAFVPLAGVTIGPDRLQVPFTKAQIKDAPEIELHDLSQADESRLYHHYELNYTPLEKENGRRLARR